VFGHDLGDDLVLAAKLFLQLGGLLLSQGASPEAAVLGKGRRAILKKRLLPLVELRRRDLVLFTNLRDRLLFQQVQPQDLDLVFGAEMPPSILFVVLFVVAHVLFRLWKSILARSRENVIPSEAEQTPPPKKKNRAASRKLAKLSRKPNLWCWKSQAMFHKLRNLVGDVHEAGSEQARTSTEAEDGKHAQDWLGPDQGFLTKPLIVWVRHFVQHAHFLYLLLSASMICRNDDAGYT